MKKILSRVMMSGALLVSVASIRAQEPVLDPSQLSVLKADSSALNALHAPQGIQGASFNPLFVGPKLTIWPYTYTAAQDGLTYSGTIVGGNPFNRGARTTTIPVVVIPLRIVLSGTVRTFDPSSPDTGCIGAGNTALALTQSSPIFQAVPNYTMNGVNVGTTTFPDAFQRAEFWPQVSAFASAYHLAFNMITKPTQTITTPNNSAGNGASFVFNGDCGGNAVGVDNPGGRYAAININWIDGQLNTIIANLGLTADQFPLFIVYRTFMTVGPPGTLSGNCCILGYHSTVSNLATPANPGQTYGIAEYDSNFLFGAGTKDISVLSHEVMEWVNDPSGVNPTPAWGNIGQVSGCQNNLEVGDPLSGTLMPAVTLGAHTYHAQEQAFFGWFYGAPFAGAGGKYSSNGTFGGFAKLCPTGGTN